MDEVTQAADLVKDICAKDANIIFGHAIVPSLKDEMQVTIIATGFNKTAPAAPPQQAAYAQQPVQQYPAQGYGGQNMYQQQGGMYQQQPRPQNNGYAPQNGYPQQNGYAPQQGGVQQSFFNQQQPRQPQQPPRRAENNGYVSLDEDNDNSWLKKLNNRK